MKPIRYFSMFSGIGGFEYGMEQSDYEFECVGFSEIDKYATSIYIRHFPNHRNFGDATEIRTEDLPDFDLLVGGFPCQAFSIAGKRRGFDDARGTLFFEIARILKDKAPRYFLLENVKGILSHNKGQTFKKILEILDELGYNVQWQIYNSKDYGVPQNRERIFIKGYSRRECGGKVLSIRKDCEKGDVIVSNTYYNGRRGRIHFPDEQMNSLCDNGHNGGGSQLIVEDKERESNGRTSQIRKVGNFSPTGHYGKNVYSANGLSPTLCSGSVVKNGLNIALEEVIASTQKHSARTDDTYAPTLTEAMGMGGGHIPMLRFKKEDLDD